MALSPTSLTLDIDDVNVIDTLERVIDGWTRNNIALMPEDNFVIVKDTFIHKVREYRNEDSYARILACLQKRYLNAGWSKFEYLKSSDSIVLTR